MDRHDAAATGRSAAVSAHAPRVLAGWPVADLGGPPLIAPGGAPVAAAPDGREALLRPGGLIAALRPAPAPRAIGGDGVRYAFAAAGDRVVARRPAGTVLWRSPAIDLGPEASDRSIVPGARAVFVTGVRGAAALDRAGRPLWVDDGGTDGTGALVVAPGDIAVYPLDAASGSLLRARRPDGAPAWERSLPGRVTALARAGDAIVAVHDRADPAGGAGIVALSAADGGERWRVGTGARVAAAPAIAADGGVAAVVAGRLWLIGPEGAVRARAGRGLSGAPLIGGDGMVYVGGAPMAAVRPSGSVAWRLPARAPAWPRAIGADGTLYVEQQGGVTLALAARGARGRAIPAPPAGPLISGLAARERGIRLSGPPSACPRGRRSCTPARPLGTVISFRLARPAVVAITVRRVDRPRAVRRLVVRAPAGISWRSARDVLSARAAPGTYLVSAHAAAGRLRATAGPLAIRVVR